MSSTRRCIVHEITHKSFECPECAHERRHRETLDTARDTTRRAEERDARKHAQTTEAAARAEEFALEQSDRREDALVESDRIRARLARDEASGRLAAVGQLGLATNCIRLKDFQRSLKHVERAIDLAPDYPWAWLLKAHVDSESGRDPAEALERAASVAALLGVADDAVAWVSIDARPEKTFRRLLFAITGASSSDAFLSLVTGNQSIPAATDRLELETYADSVPSIAEQLAGEDARQLAGLRALLGLAVPALRREQSWTPAQEWQRRWKETVQYSMSAAGRRDPATRRVALASLREITDAYAELTANVERRRDELQKEARRLQKVEGSPDVPSNAHIHSVLRRTVERTRATAVIALPLLISISCCWNLLDRPPNFHPGTDVWWPHIWGGLMRGVVAGAGIVLIVGVVAFLMESESGPEAKAAQKRVAALHMQRNDASHSVKVVQLDIEELDRVLRELRGASDTL